MKGIISEEKKRVKAGSKERCAELLKSLEAKGMVTRKEPEPVLDYRAVPRVLDYLAVPVVDYLA